MDTSYINFSSIPEYMVEPVKLYLERGICRGAFLSALFSNDLFETFRAADNCNKANLENWMKFLYNEMPTSSHGSAEKFKAWKEDRSRIS